MTPCMCAQTENEDPHHRGPSSQAADRLHRPHIWHGHQANTQTHVLCTQWDTAGQERFHTLTESYYRNSHGVVLVYDVTDRRSFDRIQHWAGQIGEYENLRLSKLLVGNKTDLTETRMVTAAEGEELAKKLGMSFVETSAKSTDNVEQAFVGIATEILHNIEFVP